MDSMLLERRASHGLSSSSRASVCKSPIAPVLRVPHAPSVRKPTTIAAAASSSPGRSDRKQLVNQVRQQSQRLHEHLRQLQSVGSAAASSPMTEVLEQLKTLDVTLATLEEQPATDPWEGVPRKGFLARTSSLDSTSSMSSSNSSGSDSDSEAGPLLNAPRTPASDFQVDDATYATAVALFSIGAARAQAVQAAATTSKFAEALRQQRLADAQQAPPAFRPPTIPEAVRPSPSLAVPEGAQGCVLVCQGKKCCRRGAAQLLQQAEMLAADAPGLKVAGVKCLGKCKEAPAVRIKAKGQPGNNYSKVQPHNLTQLLSQTFNSSA